MAHVLKKAGMKTQKGQAMVEFALASALLFFMVFATIEASRYGSLKLRMASTTREAARLFIADEIEPATYATNSAAYSTNYSLMLPIVSNNVYVPIQDMVAPADLQNKGKVIISILRRFDKPTGTPPVTSSSPTPTDASDDKVIVEYQFIFPNTGVYPAFTSQIYSMSGGYSNVYTNILPVSALSVDERTVAVEIFHKTDFIAPEGILKWGDFDFVYDMAIY